MGLLRVILALAVVVGHVDGRAGFLDPQIAVRFFYAISGFYMALVLDGKYPPTSKGVRAFYVNRALRLYPTYLLCLLIAFAVALCTQRVGGYYEGFFARYRGLGPPSTAYAVLSQALIVGQDAFLFAGIAPGSGLFFAKSFRSLPPSMQAWRLALLPTAWSLSLELLFYVLVPFLTKLRTSHLAMALVGTFLLRGVAYRLFRVHDDPWTYRFFPFEIGTFLIGVLAYRVSRDRPDLLRGVKGSAWVPWLLIPALVGLTRLPGAVLWSPLALMGALPILFHGTKSNAFDRKFGEISYPLYLGHYPILALVEAYGIPEPKPTVLLASFVLSAMIVKWIDLPVDRVRQRLARRLKGPSNPPQPS